MNFELSEEQQLIQDSVARFVQENYGLEARVELAAKEPGFSTTHWQTMAELGPETKNQISHRAKAAAKLVPILRELRIP